MGGYSSERIEFEYGSQGEILSVTLDGEKLTPRDEKELPSGRIIPGPRTGKIYIFESNPSYTRCVKRFGKWF